MAGKREGRDVTIPLLGLSSRLHMPRAARAVIAFAHGSGFSRF